MDFQAKYKAQQYSKVPPKNTIPWGDHASFSNKESRKDYIKTNTRYYQGKTRKGNYVRRIPLTVTDDLILRGQDRYNIYCATCHTKTGDGRKSLISKRGWIVANITNKTTRNKSDGELFHIINHGIRTMSGYKKRLTEEDSWAIVSYVRTLQQMYSTNYNQLNAKEKQKIRKR